VLDDSCPWEEVDIGNSVKVKRLKLPAACVSDIQLLAPTTIIYKHFKEVKDQNIVEIRIEVRCINGSLTNSMSYTYNGWRTHARITQWGGGDITR